MAHEWLRSDFTPLGGERHPGAGSHHASYSSERWGKLRSHTRSFNFNNHPTLQPVQDDALHVRTLHAEKVREDDKAPVSPPSSAPEPTALPYHVSGEELKRIQQALEGVNEWGWDVFRLREVTGGRELQTLGWHLMHAWGLVEAFDLDMPTLRRWLRYVESQYNDLPYHNSTHAADVLQTVHYMLETGGVRTYLEGMEIFAMLVAAMVHDMGHDGCNNAYHKNAVTPRALQFNDQSIQENFHLSMLFSAMKDESKAINILESFTAEEYVEIRRMMISMVLATDMSRHFVLTKEFKELAENFGANVDLWNESHDQLMCTVLHACDISNPAKPLALAKTWAGRCMKEFFRQGDMELERGLNVSPQCNRDTTFVPTSQVAFIKFVVFPTMEAMGDFLPEVATTCMPIIQSNLEYWTDQEAKELQQHKERMASLGFSQHSPRAAGTPRGAFFAHPPFRSRTSSSHEGLPDGNDHLGEQTNHIEMNQSDCNRVGSTAPLITVPSPAVRSKRPSGSTDRSSSLLGGVGEGCEDEEGE